MVNISHTTATGAGELQAQSLPLVITPGAGNVELSLWLNENRILLEEYLVQYGAVLFRGFEIDNVVKFNNLLKGFDTNPLPYMFRSSPRKEINREIKNVYLSTSYPNDRRINLHNESSYSRVWGRKIIFCCLCPAAQGGETPIADSRLVLKDLPSALREEFRAKGVKYIRNLTPDIGMPWQEVFQTTERAELIATCKKFNIDAEFVSDDHVIISWTKPAIYTHPVSGEETWFNHAFFFNKYSLYEEIGLASDEELPEETLPSNTFFGDGSEIDYAAYCSIKDAYEKNTVTFPYEKGDVIFLDNMLTAHGRNPYKGDRTIATAIVEAACDAGFILSEGNSVHQLKTAF